MYTKGIIRHTTGGCYEKPVPDHPAPRLADAVRAFPPVLFLLGAVWLKNEFALGGWVVLVGLLLGLAGSVGSLRSSLKSIDREGKEDTPRTPPPISFNNH